MWYFAWVLGIACEAGSFLARRESRQPRPKLMIAAIVAVFLGIAGFSPRTIPAASTAPAENEGSA